MPEPASTVIGYVVDVQANVLTASLVEDDQGRAPTVTIGDEDILVGDSGDKTIDEFESIVEEIKIAPFVDKEEKQEHYIVRYHSESTYREWFDTNYSEYDSMEKAVGLAGEIPEWTDNIFAWYDNSKMTNDEIQSAIKYLVDEEILIVK